MSSARADENENSCRGLKFNVIEATINIFQNVNFLAIPMDFFRTPTVGSFKQHKLYAIGRKLELF